MSVRKEKQQEKITTVDYKEMYTFFDTFSWFPTKLNSKTVKEYGLFKAPHKSYFQIDSKKLISIYKTSAFSSIFHELEFLVPNFLN